MNKFSDKITENFSHIESDLNNSNKNTLNAINNIYEKIESELNKKQHLPVVKEKKTKELISRILSQTADNSSLTKNDLENKINIIANDEEIDIENEEKINSDEKTTITNKIASWHLTILRDKIRIELHNSGIKISSWQNICQTPLVQQIRLAAPLGDVLEAEGLALEPVGAVLALLLLELLIHRILILLFCSEN